MLTPGTILQNRYRIASQLGQGGMGAVYRAWDTRLSIPLAIKELTPQPGLTQDLLAQLRAQFQQEAAILARLNHAHLVRVTDFFEEGGNTYLVMDFVEGENLAERIERQGPLSEDEVLTLAQQLLDALAYCHDQGILHRDVKPQNVILRPDGRVVLVDFGLVKLWDPNDPRTKTAMRGMGTPEYAPPEQYEADAGHTDQRSDVYSIGATLYHALTGQAPPTATLRMADPDQFVPVRGLMPQVRTETELAVLKAMELSRSERWQTADEMARHLGGKPVTPARPAPPKRDKTRLMPGTPPPPPAKKRGVPRWLWVIGGLGGLMVCGFVLILGSCSIRQAQRSAAATDQARAAATATALRVADVTMEAQANATAEAAQASATAEARASATAEVRATSTARAEQTTATAQAMATAVTDQTLLEASNWAPVLYDSFTAEANGWSTGDYSDSLIEGNKTIANDTYRWEATALGSVVWWSLPDGDPLADTYVTGEGQRISGMTSAQYGLIFRRVDRDNYYIFRIQDQGEYQLRIRYEGDWETLIPWTSSPLIQVGEIHRLAVVASGSRFTFYVNDTYLDEFTDSRLDCGKVALVIGFDSEGDSATIEFDNFEVRGSPCP